MPRVRGPVSGVLLLPRRCQARPASRLVLWGQWLAVPRALTSTKGAAVWTAVDAAILWVETGSADPLRPRPGESPHAFLIGKGPP